MEKIQAVRRYRTDQAGRLGQSLAERPTEYHVSVIPEAEFLVIPEVSSERRQYVRLAGWNRLLFRAINCWSWRTQSFGNSLS